MQKRLLLLVIASAATGAAAVAQSPATPWFGLRVPHGIGDPHAPVLAVSGAAGPALRVPAGEDAPRYSALNGVRIKKDVETIAGFSKKSRAAGDRVWGRVTGFPALAETLAWVAEQFRDAGLQDVEVQYYDASAPMWWSRGWEVRLVADPRFGAGSGDVVLESALPTSGSHLPGGSLTAPLVLVGAAEGDAPSGVDVRGRVAVQHLRPAGGAYSERGRTVQRARALFARGAAGVINVVEQVGNMHVRDFGNCGGPCFNVGTGDGAFLEQVIARAAARPEPVPLRVRLSLQSEMLSGLKGQNTVGVIPGRAGAEAENIIVNAHADGWFDAAGDNADGLAVLLALARHFSMPENSLDRTLVFVASGGHHSTGLNGPSNFVRMNPALTARTLMVLNLEHVAQVRIDARSWRVDDGEQPMNFGISNQSPFLQAAGRRGIERYGFNLNPTFSASVPGDLGGYAALGVARVQAIHSGPMYHTSGDVAATISVPGLERAGRFFAYLLGEAAKASRAELNPPQR